MTDAPLNTRVIAFYLPQFHPTPYNDEWWGRGFTEWTNVAKARPRFTGHYQPHLPADLGFYDLRLRETREAQSELARNHGIDGFLIYHYWFSGTRLLEQPVQQMLETGEPGVPFALCWANETWSRRWDGSEHEVLMRQDYSDIDDQEHLEYLATVFASDRYLRVDGKPLLAVYNAADLPNPERTADTWRKVAHRLGVGDIFLCAVERNEVLRPAEIGFDALIEFQPKNSLLSSRAYLPLRDRVRNRLLPTGHPSRSIVLNDYAELVRVASAQGQDPYLRFPGVTPGWDNSARRVMWPQVYVGSTPELYETWLRAALARPLTDAPERLVFVNAWNEWAEGNHLEPDQRTGTAYLQATRRAVDELRRA